MITSDHIEFYRRHIAEARERMESARAAGDVDHYLAAEQDYQNYTEMLEKHEKKFDSKN